MNFKDELLNFLVKKVKKNSYPQIFASRKLYFFLRKYINIKKNPRRKIENIYIFFFYLGVNICSCVPVNVCVCVRTGTQINVRVCFCLNVFCLNYLSMYLKKLTKNAC